MHVSRRVLKIILIPLGIIIFLTLAWVIFAMAGRVNSASVIPASPDIRISIHKPLNLLDGVLSHESLGEIASVDELEFILPVIDTLRVSPLVKNRFVRLALRGSLDFALLPPGEGQQSIQNPSSIMIAALDMGLLSPVLRILPWFSRFVSVPDLYYVQAGQNSRFEYRTDDMTIFIGHHKNLFFITNSSRTYENRSRLEPGENRAYTNIRPESYDAALIISPAFFDNFLAGQGDGALAIMDFIDINSPVEAGISIHPKKLEIYLAASLSSAHSALQGLLAQRGRVPDITERFPASVQYATVLSAGTLNELLEAAMILSGPLSPDLNLAGTIQQADRASRAILQMPLDELLFSWPGNEFAVYGMEGRPHPVYAIQVSDERKRQEVFEKAFTSIALSENVRLNLDGTRIPQIEIPQFLQILLRNWDIVLPSPYYFIHRDYLLLCESAETLLTAIRAIQRNEVLPRTAEWRDLAGRTSVNSAVSAFSLYYSLDVSIPFFLRDNSALGNFLRIYRQGLISLKLDRGQTSLSLALIPGSGRGIMLVNSIPIETRQRPSNQVFGASGENQNLIYISAGETVLLLDPAENSMQELSGQGQHWIIPADGSNGLNAWIVNDRGRVSLVDKSLEALPGFPVITGLRLSSPPVAYNGMVFLCDEDGKVHSIDASGNAAVWETSFFTALRSPPAFLALTTRASFGQQAGTRYFAAAYPKSFFGELWLMDLEGKALPNWPASLIRDADDSFNFDSGLGFGSPLLFTNNNRLLVAFVSQAGDLFVFDEYANHVEPFPIILEGVFYQQPVFDGDFLWLVSRDGVLFRIAMDGEVLLHSIPGFSMMEEGNLSVFDHDGDGIPEIYFTGEGNALYAFTRNFRSLEGFPLPMWGKPYFVPRRSSTQAQGAGRPGIFGMNMNGRLYHWQFR